MIFRPRECSEYVLPQKDLGCVGATPWLFVEVGFSSRTNSCLGHHDDLATKYSLLHQNQNKNTWMNSINIYLALFCTVQLNIKNALRVSGFIKLYYVVYWKGL